LGREPKEEDGRDRQQQFRPLANTYTKEKADVAYLQVTLCDPHLSA